MRLLVTIQDLDRNKEASDSLDVLAGLLDRLEDLKGIDYIFAGENTPQFSDTILRICPKRFDFSVPNLTNDVISLIDKLIDEDLKKYYLSVLLDKELEQRSGLVNMLLPSFRDFQTLSSQIESSWEYIKGEVLLYDFILFQALKNNQPKLYDVLYQMLQGNISTKDLRFNGFIEKYFTDCTPLLKKIIEDTFIHFGLISASEMPDPDKVNETLGRVISLENIYKHPLSIDKAQIHSILFSGFLDNSAFKQMVVYETLTKVAQGHENALNVLYDGFKDDNKRYLWADSLKSYGWAILYNQMQDINIAKRLIHNAIKLDLNAPVSSLLDSLRIRNIDKWMNLNCGLMNYLFSEGVIEELVGLRQHFNYFTLLSICEIYMSSESKHRYKIDELGRVRKYLNLIVNGFINSDPQGHLILLLFASSHSLKIITQLDEETLNLLLETLNTLELKDVSEEYARLTIIDGYEYKLNIDYEFNKDKNESIVFVKNLITYDGVI